MKRNYSLISFSRYILILLYLILPFLALNAEVNNIKETVLIIGSKTLKAKVVNNLLEVVW
jgi:hypothetical protein